MEMTKMCGPIDATAQISTAIKEGDVNKFNELLDINTQDFLDLFKDICNKGEVTTQAQFIGLLLERLKGDPNAKLQAGGMQLIHFAAARGLQDVLDTLLRFGANVDTLTSSGETVLHCIVRGIREGKSNENKAVECMKLLLSNKKIDIDVQDNTTNLTAIHLAAKFNYWNIVQLLIEHSAHIDITINDIKARDLINERRPDLIENYPISSEPAINLKTQLFKLLLKDENENEFLECIKNNNVENIVNVNNGKYTLLQAAITSGLEKATKKLIELRADVNLTTNGERRTPAILASYYGHDGIVQALLETRDLDLTQVEDHKFTALHASLVSSKPNMRCVKLLIERGPSKGLDINAQDYRKYTALHYAAKKNYREIIQLLMDQNVNLFLLNDQYEPAFIDVDQDYIKNYLDKAISIEGNFVDDKNYSLIFDYSLLSSKSNLSNEDIDTVQSPTNKECCYVPVPQEDNKSLQPEMEPLVMLSSSPNHRPLLNHPLIRSFLHLKWHRIFWFFYINFFIYVVFTASLSVHIYYLIAAGEKNNTNNNVTSVNGNNINDKEGETNIKTVFWWLTLISVIILIIRELFQMTLSFFMYICNMENIIEILLIVLTSFLLVVDTDYHARHSMSAITILLAYTELVLLIGRHPSLATYITMFFRVSCNFIYFLLWYSLLIIAFGFSFYILFYEQCEAPDNCEEKFFGHLGTSLFKTIIMLTGEFEAGDLEFNNISLTSHIIFLLFIFFIAIVLLNLLNGLAVSDTQAIRDEAEIVCCAAQVKLYSKMENTLLRINNTYGNNCTVRSAGYFKGIRLWLGSKILLLTGRLHEKKLRVYLNDDNRMEPDVRNSCRRSCTDCSTFGLFCFRNTCMAKGCRWCQVFNTIVSDACAVEAQHNRRTEAQEILDRLDHLENCLKIIALAVNARI